jgi:hypothetical protein
MVSDSVPETIAIPAILSPPRDVQRSRRCQESLQLQR